MQRTNNGRQQFGTAADRAHHWGVLGMDCWVAMYGLSRTGTAWGTVPPLLESLVSEDTFQAKPRAVTCSQRTVSLSSLLHLVPVNSLPRACALGSKVP